MVDPISAAKGGLSAWNTARSFGKLLSAYLGRDSEALTDLMRAGDVAWVTDFCERLRETQDVLEERFRQVHPLVTSLRWEAARDATDARRLMLACVAAYLLNSTETVDNKARVERMVRDLDPADVELLSSLYCLRSAPAFALWERHPRQSNLNTCVEVDYRPLAGFGGAGKPTLTLSETGQLILHALREFRLETLLAGFEPVLTDVRLAHWLAQQRPSTPFWTTRCSTHPLRVLTVGGGPSITAEIFSWDGERNAYVLSGATELVHLGTEEWTILGPKTNAAFFRQDNKTDGRPLIPCDPLAEPTEGELEFVHLPER